MSMEVCDIVYMWLVYIKG